MKTYAAYYNNPARMNSSSGGIFSLIATQFDVVYGVAMSKDCYGAEFVRITDGNIEALRGSKYLQAKIGDTFAKVKSDLLNSVNVLFTGTGCQINGLKCYLQKEYTNLTTVDVICHGTPPAKLWKKYVRFLEYKNDKLKEVNFRYKGTVPKSLGRKEGYIFSPKEQDAYMNLFLENCCLRPACYNCHAKFWKKSDITIGDFWGINEIAPELNDGKGVSLVIVRTEKGKDLFEKIKGCLVFKEVPYDDAVKNNPLEFRSVQKTSKRDTFFIDLNYMTFKELRRKYSAVSIGIRVKNCLKRIKAITYALLKLKTPSNSNYGLLFTFEKK